MDENTIKSLYRRHTQLHDTVLDARAADDIDATLSQHGWPADDIAPLDRVASSATAADIARIVAALGPDIDNLAAEVKAARTPRTSHVQRFLRRGLALAAGVGAFAVLFSLLNNPQQAPLDNDVALVDDNHVIMALSFEDGDALAADERAPQGAQEAIFNGNFDS